MLHRPLVALVWVVLISVASVAVVPGVSALDVPPPPPTPIFDQANLLSPGTRAALAQKIGAFERDTSNQVAVAIFPSLEDESLEDFTIRLAERWQPGQRERDNGVILAVFVRDRRVRIEVGYGLEGALPDAVAARIIRNEIAPEFRAGRFDRGIERAVDAIMAATRGEYEALPPRTRRASTWLRTILLIIVAIAIASSLSGPRGPRSHRGYWRDGVYTFPWILGAPGRRGGRKGGFGGFGGGGGGFGGFGGGGFGGGGASGGW